MEDDWLAQLTADVYKENFLFLVLVVVVSCVSIILSERWLVVSPAVASHFDLVTLVMSLGWGRRGQHRWLPVLGDYQQQGIMAITETRWLLLLRADEKSIGQNMQDFLWSQMKWLQTLQPLIYFQFTENFSKSS